MRAWTLLVGVALLLAGCTDDDGDTTPDTDTMTETPDQRGNETAEPQVYRTTETISGGAGSPVVSVQQGAAQMEFSVPDEATLVYAELRWSDGTADLDLHLGSPGTGPNEWDYANNGGQPGSPDSPHAITIESPASGAWKATAFPNGPAAGVQFDLVVTVFMGEGEVPEGYTALQ